MNINCTHLSEKPKNYHAIRLFVGQTKEYGNAEWRFTKYLKNQTGNKTRRPSENSEAYAQIKENY